MKDWSGSAMRWLIVLTVALLVSGALSKFASASWISSASGSATGRSDSIATPTGLTASCNLLLDKSVHLDWSAANSWAEYEVRWGTTSGSNYGTSATTSGTSYDTPALSGSLFGTAYFFVVRSVKGSWVSGNSNQVSKVISLLVCS